MEQQELDLREIFQILRRRIWILVALPLVAAFTAGIVSLYVLEPVYAAETKLWVIKDGSGQIEYTELLLNRNLTKTYAEVAKSRAVMADVIKSLGLQHTSIGSLQSSLTVTPKRDTEILSFTIHDRDPVMAARLADAVAAAFMGQIRTFMKLENVVVVDPAQVPTSPVKPQPLVNIVIALILGGLAALGLVFLAEYLDTSLKTPDDVTRYLGLPVLGMIPVIEDSGVHESPRRSHTRAKSQQAKTAVEK